jgi:hypothetical protein
LSVEALLLLGADRTGSFNSLKPQFKGLASEKHSPAYPHGWQVRDSANLAINDVGEVRT